MSQRVAPFQIAMKLVSHSGWSYSFSKVLKTQSNVNFPLWVIVYFAKELNFGVIKELGVVDKSV